MSEHPSAANLLKGFASSITNKTILVLGASPDSYGFHFLKAIAPYGPAHIIVGGRSPDKLSTLPSDLGLDEFKTKFETFKIDYMSFKSVRAAASHILQIQDKVDVLVNSIGTMCSPWSKSEDGWESQLQNNHLGFFLFANLLMEKLLRDKTRIVNISSEGYAAGTGVRYLDPNFHDGEVYHPLWAYGQGKTGQILFTAALARRYGDRGILSFSVQPGPSTTSTNLHAGWGKYTLEEFGKDLQRLGRMAPGQSPPPRVPLDAAIANYVVAAFDPALTSQNGAYIRNAQVVDPESMAPWAVGEVQERKCWEFSENCIGQEFPLL